MVQQSGKIIVTTPATTSRKYTSPPHALLWSFRKSRDNWKGKYRNVKAQLKRALRRLDRRYKSTPAAPPTAAPLPLLTDDRQHANKPTVSDSVSTWAVRG